MEKIKRFFCLFLCLVCLLSLSGCATTDTDKGAAAGAGIGAIAGALLGAAIGGGDGALIGALAGAAVGGAIGYYHSKQLKDREQVMRENPARQSDHMVLTMKEIAVRPVKTDSHDSQTNEQIQNGSEVDLILVYDLTSPNEGEQFQLKEVRTIHNSNAEGVKQLLFEHPENAMSEQGEMETSVRYEIPADAQEGYYNYQVNLELAGNRYSKSKDFYVIDAHAKNFPQLPHYKTVYHLGGGRYLLTDFS